MLARRFFFACLTDKDYAVWRATHSVHCTENFAWPPLRLKPGFEWPPKLAYIEQRAYYVMIARWLLKRRMQAKEEELRTYLPGLLSA